jgi:hypothetical protein
MVNEGELPEVDMKLPPMELDFPAPKLDLDLPAPGLDFPQAQLPPLSPSTAAAQAKKPQAAKPEAKAKPAKQKAAGHPATKGGSLQLVLGIISIFFLAAIAAIMFVFEVPVNVVPELTLTTYVQGLWVAVGCFFVVAMLQDVKAALMLTGANIAMLVSIFPTLWLLLDMPMNPMYFFVMGMIALLAFVYLPLGVLGTKKQAPAAAQ